MYAGVPVIAVASGGPLETVRNDVTGMPTAYFLNVLYSLTMVPTGFLCEDTPADFARAMRKMVLDINILFHLLLP